MGNLPPTVVVKTFSNEMIARMASSHLQALGIESALHKDDCGGAYPQLQLTVGVRLLVAPEDQARAAAILDEMEEQPPEESSFFEPPQRPHFLSGFVWGVVVASFLFVVLGWVL